MAKNILSLSAEDAFDYMLDSRHYVNFELPEHFRFDGILEYIRNKVGNKPFERCLNDKNPEEIDNVNLDILLNKDGKYAVRPLVLANPYLYYFLARELFTEERWEAIKLCFERFTVPHITSCALPVVPEAKEAFHNSASILNWWKRMEQRSISLSLEYKYMFVTDITNCYGCIIPQSIEWALCFKGTEYQNNDNKELSDNIQKLLRAFQHGHNIGIPQGSVLFDFIGEIILGYSDLLLHNALKAKGIDGYEIIRYRDDYKIFCNEKEKLEVISYTLQSVLESLNFRMNAQKTKLSDSIVTDAIKEDKLHYIYNTPIFNKKGCDFDGLQKHLLYILMFARDYPNSGQLRVMLSDIKDRIRAKIDSKKIIMVGEPIPVDLSFDDDEPENPKTPELMQNLKSVFFGGAAPKTETSDAVNVFSLVDRLNALKSAKKRAGSAESNSIKDIFFGNKTKKSEEVVSFKKPSVLGEDVSPLVAIATQIAVENVSVCHCVLCIIGILLETVEDETEKQELTEKVFNKFYGLPNSDYVQLWLQNLTYNKDVENGLKRYSMRLCKLAMGEKEDLLWNLSWLKPGLTEGLPYWSIVDEDHVKNMPLPDFGKRGRYGEFDDGYFVSSNSLAKKMAQARDKSGKNHFSECFNGADMLAASVSGFSRMGLTDADTERLRAVLVRYLSVLHSVYSAIPDDMSGELVSSLKNGFTAFFSNFMRKFGGYLISHDMRAKFVMTMFRSMFDREGDLDEEYKKIVSAYNEDGFIYCNPLADEIERKKGFIYECLVFIKKFEEDEESEDDSVNEKFYLSILDFLLHAAPMVVQAAVYRLAGVFLDDFDEYITPEQRSVLGSLCLSWERILETEHNEIPFVGVVDTISKNKKLDASNSYLTESNPVKQTNETNSKNGNNASSPLDGLVGDQDKLQVEREINVNYDSRVEGTSVTTTAVRREYNPSATPVTSSANKNNGNSALKEHSNAEGTTLIGEGRAIWEPVSSTDDSNIYMKNGVFSKAHKGTHILSKTSEGESDRSVGLHIGSDSKKVESARDDAADLIIAIANKLSDTAKKKAIDTVVNLTKTMITSTAAENGFNKYAQASKISNFTDLVSLHVVLSFAQKSITPDSNSEYAKRLKILTDSEALDGFSDAQFIFIGKSPKGPGVDSSWSKYTPFSLLMSGAAKDMASSENAGMNAAHLFFHAYPMVYNNLMVQMAKELVKESGGSLPADLTSAVSKLGMEWEATLNSCHDKIPALPNIKSEDYTSI